MALRVLSAILFSPRGGSAPVARSLAGGLRQLGCQVTLVAGSRADLDGHGDATRFYEDVHAVSFDRALASGAPLRYRGPAGHAPMHPSYEERPGAPDQVFAMLDDLDYERQVRAWARELERAGAREVDVLHLHHLTPLREAAARVAPEVPVVGQLHGTELLMLEQIAAGPPPGWLYAERWAQRLRRWAASCSALLVAPSGLERAQSLLGVPRELLAELPNGVDTEMFHPREVDRRSFWREVLVERPRGWRPGEGPGSVSYGEHEIERLAGATILVYVGRFTAVKRLDLLIEACAQAQHEAGAPASLVLVGGHPGEWEGEHPAQTADRLGLPQVFLAGWRRHDELPQFYAAADVVVSGAVREQFGQLLLEGMACGLPAVAPRAMGPATIIENGVTGWLADPTNPAALAKALSETIRCPEERRRRGRAAREVVRDSYSWPAVCQRLEQILSQNSAQRRRRDRPPAASDPLR